MTKRNLSESVPIYMDNAATTPVAPEVVEAMIPVLTDQFANPSSAHPLGLEVRRLINSGRAQLASFINAQPSEIVFTSGGTESDNLAVFGGARRADAPGRHIVVAAIEHSAVLEACHSLEDDGFKVSYVDVDATGHISVEHVLAALTNETALVSVMLVNNEVGTIQPIKKIAAALRPHATLLHTDAVQALGKIPVDVRELGVDLASFSAHKIHGPKGIGALYVRRGIRLNFTQVGGEQEGGRRAGTENVPGILGFAAAVKLLESKVLPSKRVVTLRDRLEHGLKSLPGISFCGGEPRSPNLLNVVFRGVDGDYLAQSLQKVGICISSGSACTSGRNAPSHVLTAMGVSPTLARSAVRFSISDTTTSDEVDLVLNAVNSIIRKIATST